MSCYGRVLAVERGFDVAVNGCGNKAIGVSSKSVKWHRKKVKIFFRAIMGDFDAVFACLRGVFTVFVRKSPFRGGERGIKMGVFYKRGPI